MSEKIAHVIPLRSNPAIILIYDPEINQVFYCPDGIEKYQIEKVKVWSSRASTEDNRCDEEFDIHLPVTIKYDREWYKRVFDWIMKDSGAVSMNIDDLQCKDHDYFFCGLTPFGELYREYSAEDPILKEHLNNPY